MHVFLCYFCAFLAFFFLFLPLVTEKDEKTCFKAETNGFDQQMVCGAPVRWSKYTTILSRVDGAKLNTKTAMLG